MNMFDTANKPNKPDGVSPFDVSALLFFQKTFLWESETSLSLISSEQPVLFETEHINGHPYLPAEELTNLRARYRIQPKVNGLFLISLNTPPGTKPLGQLLLTTRGLYWWDTITKEHCRAFLPEIDTLHLEGQLSFPGYKLRLKNKTQSNIIVSAHPVLLENLLKVMQDMTYLYPQWQINLLTASPQVISTLPGCTSQIGRKVASVIESITASLKKDIESKMASQTLMRDLLGESGLPVEYWDEWKLMCTIQPVDIHETLPVRKLDI
ncbi:MAG: hypothetical protein K2X01_03215 [Cyanobacteria bacterium]|nr:hypothetical protein [Cyanobacteriota bacterium]